MRKGLWMQTYTGKAFYPLDPRPEDICIEDISHALSRICRFAGHCKDFYSVAEHSIYVSRMVPREHALQGLLHDATEAYCQDIPRPLKVNLPEYKKVEIQIRAAICLKFDLDFHEPSAVKQADNDILLSEHKALFSPPPAHWEVPGGKDRGIHIRALVPAAAEYEFMVRFTALNEERRVNRGT